MKTQRHHVDCVLMKINLMLKKQKVTGGLTKPPTSLNQGNLRVPHQEWNRSPEKVWLWPEIRVEYCHVLAMLHIASLEAFFQRTSFVTRSVLPYLVRYVDAFTCPSQTFLLHHFLIIHKHGKNNIMPY